MSKHVKGRKMSKHVNMYVQQVAKYGGNRSTAAGGPFSSPLTPSQYFGAVFGPLGLRRVCFGVYVSPIIESFISWWKIINFQNVRNFLENPPGRAAFRTPQHVARADTGNAVLVALGVRPLCAAFVSPPPFGVCFSPFCCR